MDSPLASVVPLSLLFYPLSPRYISRKETCSPWQRVNSATAPASVLQQEPVSSGMMKKMYVATTRCVAAAVVSAVVGGCSDERIRAPVLHDASQIGYCRY